MSEARELPVDRFLDGSHVKGAELCSEPRLVDGHPLAREHVDLVVSHVGIRGLLHVALGPTGRVLYARVEQCIVASRHVDVIRTVVRRLVAEALEQRLEVANLDWLIGAAGAL